MTFSEIVKARRRELELSQVEIAQTAGTTQQYMTQIERYGTEPKFTLGCAILIALDLHPLDVFRELTEE